jgi:hypothetical protein
MDGHGVSIECRFISLVLVNAPDFGDAGVPLTSVPLCAIPRSSEEIWS